MSCSVDVVSPPPVSPPAPVPLMDPRCAHCHNVALHYRLLYSDYVARMEELHILRHSQSEHSSLVQELHHLRELFEKQRQELESRASPRGDRVNAGLFEYLKTISGEHQRRVKEMREAFDEKMRVLSEHHAMEMETLRASLPPAAPVPAPDTAMVDQLANVQRDYAAALEREVAVQAEMRQLQARLEETEGVVKTLTTQITDMAADTALETVSLESQLADAKQRLDVAQQLVASLKSSNQDLEYAVAAHNDTRLELTKKLRLASDNLQETQRTNFTEQQEILKKRDQLQVRLFDTLQSVTALQRAKEEAEAKLAQQEVYVQLARDVQALVLQLPDTDACPALVPPAGSPASGGSGATSKKGKKKK